MSAYRIIDRLHIDNEPAAGIHGVACVDDEVDQRGFKLVDIGLGKAGIRPAGLVNDLDLPAHQRKRGEHRLTGCRP